MDKIVMQDIFYRVSRLNNMTARTPNVWIFQNLKSGKLVSRYGSLPFIFECLVALKKHRESTKPESRHTAKMFWKDM